jgi:hypothetical protein
MKEVGKRNKFDHKDSLEIGESAQSQFAEIARRKGWSASRASGECDRNEHWDFLIEKGEQKFKVDVKSRKRIGRGDSKFQDEWIWIELHSVRTDNPGWLFGSTADLIAFETKDSFVMVQRPDLICLVEASVDFKSRVSTAKEAQYKIYSRRNRPDKITLIELEKVKTLKFAEWKKQPKIMNE